MSYNPKVDLIYVNDLLYGQGQMLASRNLFHTANGSNFKNQKMVLPPSTPLSGASDLSG